MGLLNHISPAWRLSIVLALSTLSVLLLASAIGLFPDSMKLAAAARLQLGEAIGLQLALAAQQGDDESFERVASMILERTEGLRSIGLRTTEDGELIFSSAGHERLWEEHPGRRVPTHVTLPLFADDQEWAAAELRFEENEQSVLSGHMQLCLFVVLACFLVFRLYLRRVLRYLDPSSVIPERVKTMLDTMAEGVIVLDDTERVVLANETFLAVSGLSLAELQGMKASEIPWQHAEKRRPLADFPWEEAARGGLPKRGVELRLKREEDDEQVFVVNTSPILAGDGSSRGALVTFDDVTAIEQKNARLQKTVRELDEVRMKVQKQNEALQLLATHDTLTECLNRRAMFERLEAEWSGAERHDQALACIMLDIDHFKSINDNHGHAMGDQVLQRTAKTIKDSVRKRDIVGRYGGEEFCIILPHTDLSQGAAVAAKICESIANAPIAGITVTASLGVSAADLGATTPQELVDQADQALYAAKHGGRNQTVCWNAMNEIRRTAPGPDGGPIPMPTEHVPIPFHAVAALMSALNHRDPSTAAHCQRVADLAVAIAMDHMSAGDRFVLEIGALLHDIGKIGVPDAILLKPDQLTEEEWQIMESHDRIGIDIINSAFNCPELTNIVANHHAAFGGAGGDPSRARGHDIPLRARILTIADAYDAMVSDRVYRKGLPHQEAIAELRRCAGTQFDPDLVEHAIDVIEARDEGRAASALPRTTEVMLGLGLVIERLTVALDAQDFTSLQTLAARVCSIAARYEWPEMVALAEDLCAVAEQRDDLAVIVEATRNLLDRCHLAQTAFLTSMEDSSGESLAA